MSVYDLFRGFFGFQGGPRPRDPFFGGITREDDNDEDDEEDDEGGPSFGPGGFGSFGFPFGPGGMRFHDAFGFEELFRDFNDLFSDMGAMGLPSRPPLDMPGLEGPPPPPGDPSFPKRRTLRDSMLKYPDSPGPQGRAVDDGLRPPPPEKKPWPPFQAPGEDPSAPVDIPKEDGDLDSRVRSEGLRTVLPPPSQQPRSYFRSVSVTKVVAPDGTVEERRTTRDSQGHEETVVTRRSGAEPLLDRTGPPRREDVLGDAPSLLDVFFGRWFR